ncbi:G-type lectin S-receptor-like serine/threonine-protein kinase At1g34300 [Juglans microcarpa x Juglans regia]|uniref:G-type lectin S-receptor-like serine/threonine-protein kinase At1g34300 n=1 Tax=Juglans microcarpa x Juglans regia TaxID=2249226 RepID=UPI001B7E34CA|nr:G-type lectin S-receptor-like serine/threonine-protein kinase At1g34300 [Juglans microcarpa x Juglans regia]
MATQILSFLFLFAVAFLLSISPPSSAQQQAPSLTFSSFKSSDSPWSPGQNRILVSPNSVFAAGFQLLPSSKTHYNFSVWYRNVSGSPIVWSTNKASAVNGSASLVITTSGQLRLNDFSGRNLWPWDASGPNSSLILSNEGNLSFASWQSFKFPTDTILPSQIITNTTLVSKNGKYSFANSSKLLFNNTDSYWEAANGSPFQMLQNDGRMVQNVGSFIPADFGSTDLRRLTLDDDGNLGIYSYDPDQKAWVVVWKAMQEMCRVYGTCGPNAICMSDGSNSSTNCACPPGFRQRSGGEQEGCDIKIPINNPAKTKFLQLDYVNYTSGANNTNQTTARNLAECQANCYKEAKCLGFGFKYDGKGYCNLQLERLLYGYWSPGTEAVMYLRVDSSETDISNFRGMTKLLETTCPVNISLPLPPEESSTTARNIAIICTLFAAELLSGVFFFWRFLKKYIKYRDMAQTLGLEFLPAGGPKRFTYAELKAATKDFSNLIGKGGFGDVYKGELPDHRVVAVKCLKHVAGGDAEFWAEVTIIARMHHLNLVRLWGFCAEKGKRILVYEYVPNGSLDKYIFHSARANSREDGELEMGPLSENGLNPILDWGVRYRIALGVARAIAYLHEECLEWVLHCDIKPENILLGDDFCPKISDFGLAKLKKKEDMVSMSRMRGTRGYMAPEWVRSDPITAKADVYSFGMVLLEIVTGTRNFEMQGSVKHSEDWYFPGWAFDKVYKEIKVEDILDRRIKHSYDNRAHFHLVDRMVKTAMWCLQDRPEKRPPMGKLAKMLEGTVEITEPGKPTIFFLGDE